MHSRARPSLPHRLRPISAARSALHLRVCEHCPCPRPAGQQASTKQRKAHFGVFQVELRRDLAQRRRDHSTIHVDEDVEQADGNENALSCGRESFLELLGLRLHATALSEARQWSDGPRGQTAH